jgi:hypothetical protein
MTDTTTDARDAAERELKVEGLRDLFATLDEDDHASAKGRAARILGHTLADIGLAARSFARVAHAAEDAAASLRVIADEMRAARAHRERERRSSRG